VNQDHNRRIVRLRRAFVEANGRFLARLRGVDDDAAVQAAAEGGWSAAQIGWHVASVSSQFAGLMSGEVVGARRLADDFHERAIPARLQAPPTARSPADVTRSEAIAPPATASRVRLSARSISIRLPSPTTAAAR
jgi:uncharacterized damage-inducible protein DinB